MFTTRFKTSAKWLVALTGIAVVATACGSAAGNDADFAPKTTIKLGYFLDASREQATLSKAFDGTDYNIEWVQVTGAAPMAQALSSGGVDVGWLLGSTNIALASATDVEPWTSESAPYKLVGYADPIDPVGHPTVIVGANQSSGITSLADLKGKSFAYSEGGNTEAIAKLALRSAGLSVDDVTATPLPANAIPAALIAGQVDAAAVPPAQLGSSLSDGTVKQISSGAEVGFPSRASILATQGALADAKKSAAIGDLVERITAFHQWAIANPDVAAQAYVTTQGLSESQARGAVDSLLTTIVPVDADEPVVAAEKQLVSELVRLGIVPREVDYQALLDDRYTEQIESGNR